MDRKKIKAKKWYAYTVAICAGVLLFVVLTHLGSIWKATTTFVGFFAPVIGGCVIAYLINPLAKFYSRKIFGGIKRDALKGVVSNAVAYITVFLLITLIFVLMIPELIDSVRLFARNISQYASSLDHILAVMGHDLSISDLYGSTDTLMHKFSSYITKNADTIVAATARIGASILQWVMALLLSMYILASKATIKGGLKRLLRAFLNETNFQTSIVYLRRCNEILNRYIVFNLLDAIIVGIVNMIFMTTAGMPYAGLVSIVVAVMNLVPTFGPVVGGAIGVFILVVVKPWYAVAFLIFTLILQILDGYVIKPRLFGGSLGVPSVWILIAIVVCGNMFGIIGIILAVPIIAIIYFTYHDYFMPWLEHRAEQREGS